MFSPQMNLLDSHDVSRFLSPAARTGGLMNWRCFFLMTFQVYAIFYGDELGVEGCAGG